MSTVTEGRLLSLFQLSDSFFPIGSYSLSFGLETFAQLGELRTEADVSSLLSVFVEQLSTADCPALIAAYHAAEKSELQIVKAIDHKLASFKNVREFYEGITRTGRALLRTVQSFASSKLLTQYTSLVERKETPGTYAVCLGMVSQSLQIDAESAVMLMLYTSTISMLGAAIRLGHITHEQAQRILYNSRSLIQHAAKKSATIPWTQLRQFSPILDIMGMKHAYLPARMFSC
ncbi:MAG: urease accessory protein UreF [Candidatus Bathyarchaeia archaeon]